MPKVSYFTLGEKLEFQTEGAGAVDLHIVGDHTIGKGEVHVINTGIYMGIPEGYVGSIVMRSSYAKKGLIIPNAPGTVDSDYRGEVKILLANISNTPIELSDGHRVAQMKFEKVETFELEEVDHVKKLGWTKRGTGGLGSTGA